MSVYPSHTNLECQAKIGRAGHRLVFALQLNKGLTIFNYSVDLPKNKGIITTALDKCVDVTLAIHEKIPAILLHILGAVDQRMRLDAWRHAGPGHRSRRAPFSAR
jgi:hypothetical protein